MKYIVWIVTIYAFLKILEDLSKRANPQFGGGTSGGGGATGAW